MKAALTLDRVSLKKLVLDIGVHGEVSGLDKVARSAVSIDKTRKEL